MSNKNSSTYMEAPDGTQVGGYRLTCEYCRYTHHSTTYVVDNLMYCPQCFPQAVQVKLALKALKDSEDKEQTK